MLMVAAMFTNRPIYDSIRTCDVGLSQRGLCLVAKKPNLEDCESDQSVAYFVSANFGLVGLQAATEVPDPASAAAPITAKIEALIALMAFSQVKSCPLLD